MTAALPNIAGIIRRKGRIMVILADAYQPKPNGIIYLSAVDLRACVRQFSRKCVQPVGEGGKIE